MSSVKPYGPRLVVQPLDDEERVRPSGLILFNVLPRCVQRGIVIEVGLQTDSRLPTLEPGMVVYYNHCDAMEIDDQHMITLYNVIAIEEGE